MTKENKLIADQVAAEKLAYKEKPHRDLAYNAKEAADKLGMASAQSTLITLAEQASEFHDVDNDERPLPKSPLVPDGVAEHQAHIVAAANSYAKLNTQIRNGEFPRSVLLFSDHGSLDQSPVFANRANEVISIFGGDKIVADTKTENTRRTVFKSGIPGYHVRLTSSIDGEKVHAVRRRGTKKRTA